MTVSGFAVAIGTAGARLAGAGGQRLVIKPADGAAALEDPEAVVRVVDAI